MTMQNIAMTSFAISGFFEVPPGSMKNLPSAGMRQHKWLNLAGVCARMFLPLAL